MREAMVIRVQTWWVGLLVLDVTRRMHVDVHAQAQAQAHDVMGSAPPPVWYAMVRCAVWWY